MYSKYNIIKYNIIPKKILRKDALAYIRFLTKVAVTSIQALQVGRLPNPKEGFPTCYPPHLSTPLKMRDCFNYFSPSTHTRVILVRGTVTDLDPEKRKIRKFLKNESHLQVYFHANQTHFDKKTLARSSF